MDYQNRVSQGLSSAIFTRDLHESEVFLSHQGSDCGIGRSNKDVCGALTGGILAVGFLFGRSQPGAEWQKAYESAAELRKRFMEKYGTTNFPIPGGRLFYSH